MADETTPPPADPIAVLFGTISALIGASGARTPTQARNQRYLGFAAVGLTLLQNFGLLPVFRPAPPAPVAAPASAPVTTTYPATAHK